MTLSSKVTLEDAQKEDISKIWAGKTGLFRKVVGGPSPKSKLSREKKNGSKLLTVTGPGLESGPYLGHATNKNGAFLIIGNDNYEN